MIINVVNINVISKTIFVNKNINGKVNIPKNPIKTKIVYGCIFLEDKKCLSTKLVAAHKITPAKA